MKKSMELKTISEQVDGQPAYEQVSNKYGLFPSWRLSLSIVGFLGTVVLYMMRANMSVAIVCMVIPDNDTKSANTTDDKCPGREDDDDDSSDVMGEFDWSRDSTGLVLSSFYIGYLLTQIPAGWLSKKVGGKILILIGMIVLTAATLLTPVAARTSVYFLMVMQAIKGGASGLYYPPFYNIWGLWAPPGERSLLVNIYMAGAPIGTVLSSIFSGLLCEHGFDNGWPSIFYIFGAVSILWCVLWVIVGADSPASHRWISEDEIHYIQEELGTGKASGEEKSLSVPWKSLLTTMPLYAILVADVCYHWGWFLALTSLPTYLSEVLKFNITKNGLYNSLPYLGNFVLSLGGAVLADFILHKELLSRTWTRKLMATIGFVPSAGMAIGISFLTCQQWGLAVGLMTAWVALMGFVRSGSCVNQVDIAPAYVGLINGMDQTLSTIPGIVAPYITTAMTPNKSQKEWQVVFFVGAGIFLFGWFFYTLFGSGVEREWAKRAKPTSKPDEVDTAATELGGVEHYNLGYVKDGDTDGDIISYRF